MKRLGGERAAPALIVFAREPIPGAVKTRLIPLIGAAGAARLADAFVRDALAKAAKVEGVLRVLAGDSPDGVNRSGYFRRISRRYGAELIDQGQGDLGRRMARALARYSHPAGAVLIGTDTPSLPLWFIREAIDDLRHAPVVIAPALDGGYYLAGVRGPVPDIFGPLNWGGKRVMSQTLARLRRLKVAYRLGRWWYDIDRASDLELLAEALVGRGRIPCPATAAVLRDLGLLGRRNAAR
jgi:rSAM/selenodomain-associated transferase 1